jgi:hypothetical protein
MKDFRHLKVWENAHEMALAAYKLTTVTNIHSWCSGSAFQIGQARNGMLFTVT